MGAENFQKTAESNRSAKRARVLLAAKLQTSFGEVEGIFSDYLSNRDRFSAESSAANLEDDRSIEADAA